MALYLLALQRRVRLAWGRARSIVTRTRIPADWSPAIAKRRMRLVHRGHGSRVLMGRCGALGEDCREVALKVVRDKAVEARQEIDILRHRCACGGFHRWGCSSARRPIVRV